MATSRAFVFGLRQPFEPALRERDFTLPEVEQDGILVRATIANIMDHEMTLWIERPRWHG